MSIGDRDMPMKNPAEEFLRIWDSEIVPRLHPSVSVHLKYIGRNKIKIEGLEVCESHRHLGIGSSVIDQMCSIAYRHSVSLVIKPDLSSLTSLAKSYEKFGFIPVAQDRLEYNPSHSHSSSMRYKHGALPKMQDNEKLIDINKDIESQSTDWEVENQIAHQPSF
jgi:hypothetical protein